MCFFYFSLQKEYISKITKVKKEREPEKKRVRFLIRFDSHKLCTLETETTEREQHKRNIYKRGYLFERKFQNYVCTQCLLYRKFYCYSGILWDCLELSKENWQQINFLKNKKNRICWENLFSSFPSFLLYLAYIRIFIHFH